MIKKYFSNNCIKVNNTTYISKFIILNNDNRFYQLKEYIKEKDEYRTIKETFNYYGFLDALNQHNIKKYFSEKQF